MTKHKKHASHDNLTLSNKRCSTSEEKTDFFDLISVDLLIKILSKLPVKSIARCRVVSKLCSSIIRSHNYNNLFPIKPPSEPRFLLALGDTQKMFLHTSPQPQSPVENSYAIISTSHHPIALNTSFSRISRPVYGLVCVQHVHFHRYTTMICNPITGEYIILPVMDHGINKSKSGTLRYYLGYDPIEKHFKVLSIKWVFRSHTCEYQVLTLGQNILLWRNIQSCEIDYPVLSEDGDGICIDGVLYYVAWFNDGRVNTIVCFDFRSEKFGFVNVEQDMATKISRPFTMTLMDCNGKLGAYNSYIEESGIFELCVLENAEKHEWSTHVYTLLSCPRHVRPCGMLSSGEIVLCPIWPSGRYYIYYYNLDKNFITRVRVKCQIFREFGDCEIYLYPNYLENFKLM